MELKEKYQQLRQMDNPILLAVHNAPLFIEPFAHALANALWTNTTVIIKDDLDYNHIDSIIREKRPDIVVIGEVLDFFAPHPQLGVSGEAVASFVRDTVPHAIIIMVVEDDPPIATAADITISMRDSFKEFLLKLLRSSE